MTATTHSSLAVGYHCRGCVLHAEAEASCMVLKVCACIAQGPNKAVCPSSMSNVDLPNFTQQKASVPRIGKRSCTSQMNVGHNVRLNIACLDEQSASGQPHRMCHQIAANGTDAHQALREQNM